MGSRIRENPTHIFECFCEVVISNNDVPRAWILQKYPHDFSDEEMLKSVPEFACPCEFTNDAVQHFSFVLTSLDSKWTFGYCRHTPKTPTLIVLLSFLPWHETFYKLLNQIAELTNDKESGMMTKFLEALYVSPVPEPGLNLHVSYGPKEFVVFCPNHLKLPSIPENRNLTEYFNAIDAHNMMVVFASMLHERRIMVTSKKLSRLSACVQAANFLIYPMHWQHIFIPVLPKHLLDYLSAPMPFLIGVPSITLLQVKHSELGEVVVLDADNNRVKTPFKDLETLPSEIVSSLKRRLKNPNMMLGDGVAKAFMTTLVQLIGGYRDALKLTIGEKISFDEDAFIQTRPPSIQPFIESMLHLQIFQQFIEDRLDMLNSGTGFSDEFELEVSLYEVNASTHLKGQYKEWVTTMKKEGGAFLKNVKNKTNPAVKSAYKTVKAKSRRAIKDIRLKIQDLQRHSSQPDLLYDRSGGKPKSAPSSPTVPRPNAFDIVARNKRMTYSRDENRSKHGTLESMNMPNSMSVSGIRRYKMLTVDEMSMASEESYSDNDNSPSMQRLDMDLMGDLQDIIFRRCSVSNENINLVGNNGSSAFKENSDENDPFAPSPLGFADSFCSGNEVFLPAPLPPPRTKRKLTSSKTLPSAVTILASEVPGKTKDEPLIKLESPDDDALFDPLKDANFKDTELLPFFAPMKPAADDSVSELKDQLQQLSSSPMHGANFHTSAYFPGRSCFPPNPSQPGLMLQRTSQPIYPVPGARSVQPNVHTTLRSFTNGATEVEKQTDQKPALPPKTRWSSASTFFVSANSLSQTDQDLLEDYGLSTSPIFTRSSVVDSGSTSTAANKHNTSKQKPPSQDPFNFLPNQDSANSSSSKQKSKPRSTWQKFV